jgi:hypothetical protein
MGELLSLIGEIVAEVFMEIFVKSLAAVIALLFLAIKTIIKPWKKPKQHAQEQMIIAPPTQESRYRRRTKHRL